MALKWSSVSAQDVERACAQVAGGAKDKVSGIVVWSEGRALPAKEVLRVAYRLAERLSPDAEVDFASGEATLNVLRKLGFRAERLGPRRTPGARS